MSFFKNPTGQPDSTPENLSLSPTAAAWKRMEIIILERCMPADHQEMDPTTVLELWL